MGQGDVARHVLMGEVAVEKGLPLDEAQVFE